MKPIKGREDLRLRKVVEGYFSRRHTESFHMIGREVTRGVK